MACFDGPGGSYSQDLINTCYMVTTQDMKPGHLAG